MHIEHELSQNQPSLILKYIERSGWIILGLVSTGALLSTSLPFAAGVALGGILSLGNFRCVDLYFSRVFRHGGSKPKWWEHAIYGLRFLILLGAIVVLIAWGRLPVVSVVLGLSAPLMGILSFAVISLAKEETTAKA